MAPERLRITTAVFAACAIAAGCSTPTRVQTIAEWESALTRDFPGKTRQQVMEASERLWRLSDADDYLIAPTEDGLQATREWSIFFVIGGARGWDQWSLKVKDTATGVSARVAVGQTSSDTGGMLMPGGGAAITNTPHQSPIIGGTALYALYWARMEYLLGLRPDWMTCKQTDALIESGALWGPTTPLCDSITVKDAQPDPRAVVTP